MIDLPTELVEQSSDGKLPTPILAHVVDVV